MNFETKALKHGRSCTFHLCQLIRNTVGESCVTYSSVTDSRDALTADPQNNVREATDSGAFRETSFFWLYPRGKLLIRF